MNLHLGLSTRTRRNCAREPARSWLRGIAALALVFMLLPLAPGWAESMVVAGGIVLDDSVEPPKPPPPPPPATLLYTNGETLEGSLMAASATSASWSSSLFSQPLPLAWSAIHRIDWSPAAPPTVAEQFLFSMRDGSAFYGNLVAITSTSVSLHSGRLGNATINRSHLLSIRRIRGGSLLYAGPTGENSWLGMKMDNGGQISKKGTVTDDNGFRDFESGSAASLQIPYWNRGARLQIPFRDGLDMEFHLHSTKRPQFAFFFGSRGRSTFRFGTWSDQIVFSDEADFQKVLDLPADATQVALRFCWQFKSGHCVVLNPAGDVLADFKFPASAVPGPPVLFLWNNGGSLSLDFIRIRAWNGVTPAKVDLAQPRIDLSDGATVAAAVTSASGATVLTSASSYSLDAVEALYLSRNASTSAGAQAAISSGTASIPVRLTYADGTYLQGQLLSCTDASFTLATSFSNQPLDASVVSLRTLLVDIPSAPPLPALASLDRLKIKESELHGLFVPQGPSTSATEASPLWLAMGAVAPVQLTSSYQLYRHLPQKLPSADKPQVADLSQEPQSGAGSTLLYTRGGDIIPVTIHSLDRSGVEFDSPIVSASKLPANALQAVVFDESGSLNLHGFNDPGWRILTGRESSSVVRDGDGLRLDPGAAIGHPALMQCGEIRFTLPTVGLNPLRFRLFCNGVDPSKSVNFLIAGMSHEVICGLEATEGQFQEPRLQIAVPESNVKVRLGIRDQEVQVFLNGVCMLRLPVPPTLRYGSGLIIEPVSIWGNRVTTVKVSGFSTISDPGRTSLPSIDPDAKTQALTIPRFRHDDPPLHALIATNGDVLRGEVEAATAGHFAFRSGLDDLAIPRERVKAVVFLPKPQATAAGQPPTKKPGSSWLLRNVPGPIHFRGANLSVYVSFLRGTVGGLDFRLPPHFTDSRIFVSIGGGPLSTSLDALSRAYGLEYTIDDNGVVTFGAANAPAGSMVQRLFWLHAGALPDDGAPEKALAAKGAAFPPDSTVSWDFASGQLSVVNTPANLDALQHILEADFGGTVGAPTHWLLLSSGARIGLAVDHFGADVITGTHPIYGRCKIPTSQVVSIRTTPFDPSPVMSTLGDWRLVYAPEPVLPEAGGDASAQIGKPAADFKVPLLAGGDFQLSAQKGKVVVLDFWATWCGPCVHSLPGLIEAMAAFPQDKVAFIGVNQDEPAATVKQFLETRGWKLPVALDAGAKVGQQYGVDAIPHTVIIGPDGKIAWVKTGYTDTGDADAAKQVSQLLNAPH